MIKHLSLLAACGLLAAGSTLLAQETQIEVETAPKDVTIIRNFGMHCGGGSYLGVMLEEVPNGKASELGLKSESGAVVQKVLEESPALAAGIKDNDVIVGWNGTKVESVRQLIRLVQETPAGRKISLDIVRAGQPMKIDATIGTRKNTFENFLPQGFDSTFHFKMDELGARMEKLGEGWDTLFKEGNIDVDVQGFMPHGDMKGFMFMGQRRGRLGVEMQDLSPQLAAYFGTTEKSGALISSVVDSTPAFSAGLQAGDVIVSIEGEKVTGPGDVAKIIGAREEGPVRITVLRDKREQTITATLGKKEEGTFGPDFFNKGFRRFKFDGNGPQKFEFRYFVPKGGAMPLPESDELEEMDEVAPEADEAPEFSFAPREEGIGFGMATPPPPPAPWITSPFNLIEI